MDVQKEVAIAIAVSSLSFSSLCNLLIEKGVISKEEKERIVNDAKNKIEKALLEEIK